MKKKNKKGSHVGIVLSLVIFVGFLLFLYIITGPGLGTQKDKQALMDSLKLKLRDEFSANLTTVTISNNSDPLLYDCLQIDNTALDTNGMSSSIKDSGGSQVDFKNTGNYLNINWINNQPFFKIYYSEEEFKDYSSSFTCSSTETNYIVSSLKTNKKIFETKIINFTDIYENYYEDIKDILKIPAGSEFGFKFTYSNGTVIETANKDISLNIYAEKIPIQYVDREANINSGSLTIKVW